MADNIIEEQVQITPEQQAADAKAQLDQLMNRNLGIAPAQETQTVTENEQAIVTEPEAIQAPEFKFDTFKEKFGYTAPDEVIAEIENLRAFKAAPPKEDLKFENEQSEKLFKAFTGGKQKEVLAYLAEQDKLENISSLEVNESTAEDIIKAGMALKYKGLTADMINHRFNKQFGIPKEPVIKSDEEPEDFEVRKSAWKEQVAEIKMERQIEANLIKPEIESAKSKLVIPEIPQSVDPTYLQWKQEQEELKTVNAEVYEAYSKFKPSDVETKIPYTDEASKMNFVFQYVPDEKGFKTSQDMVTDMDKFYAMFKNSDGSPNRPKFLAAVDFMVNKDKIIAEAIKQGKNAYIKGNLPDNSGQQREIPTLPHEETELEKGMRQAGIKR